MKAICFLTRANQNSYYFLLKKLRDGDNMGRGGYPVTTTLALDILIRIEGGIWVNQKSSTYENCGGRVGQNHKEHMGHTFTQQ